MAGNNLVLRDVNKTEPYYFACGGLADIYKGQWTRHGEVLSVRFFDPISEMIPKLTILPLPGGHQIYSPMYLE
jgi:hypothetical protein